MAKLIDTTEAGVRAIAFPYCSFELRLGRLVVIVVVVISVEMVNRKRGAHKIDCVDEATIGMLLIVCH